VKKIGNWAFSGCSSLDHFAFGTNVESIGQEAFSDCTNVTNIRSYSAIPPVCGTQALDDINKWNCTLSVLENCQSAYQAAEQWKEFFFVDAMDKDGMNYHDAAMQAAKLRFRAVMMTAIAFLLGLLPLVFAKGAGAGSRHSIGISVFGGMLAVTVFGSILVPAFFSMVSRMKEKFYTNRIKSGGSK
jgi:hypothetical protein